MDRFNERRRSFSRRSSVFKAYRHAGGNRPMVRERFIARWRRMALTMGFTTFLHGRVSEMV